MKISGTIKLICNPVSGTSKAGKDWTKQEFVVTLDGGGNYPDEICVSAFGEKIEIVQNMTVGQHVDLLVDTRAQEYNGRYFNSVSLYRIGGDTPQPQQADLPAPVTVDPVPVFEQSADDGLPF